MVQTDKIRDRFSMAATRYDAHALLHRSIADDLIKRLAPTQAYGHIVDIGCGTGYLTRQLKAMHPLSDVTGIDIAQGMIDVAKQHKAPINWRVGDVTTDAVIIQPADLIVSNLAYQWIWPNDPNFNTIKQLLKPDGKALMAVFGQTSCAELMESFHLNGHMLKQRLPLYDQLKNAWESLPFSFKQVSREQRILEFSNVMELLQWFRAIGANQFTSQGYLGKALLRRVDQYYREHYSYNRGIKVSFEVIWLGIGL